MEIVKNFIPFILFISLASTKKYDRVLPFKQTDFSARAAGPFYVTFFPTSKNNACRLGFDLRVYTAYYNFKSNGVKWWLERFQYFMHVFSSKVKPLEERVFEKKPRQINDIWLIEIFQWMTKRNDVFLGMRDVTTHFSF
jgi:hypothetical protein